MKFANDNFEMIRGALKFIVGSLICVVFSVLLFTDIGARAVFELGVVMNTEVVDTSDLSYLEYYEVKHYIAKTVSYRVFIDGDNAGSYTAALDFLKFVKQNADIGIIRIDNGDADHLNAYLETGDPAALTDSRLDETELSFVGAVYYYNTKLPPQKRVMFAVGGECGESEFMLIKNKYDKSYKTDGILDVNCIYPGSRGCDPLFDIRTNKLRFGSTGKLDWYAERLTAVSGNFGQPEFGGINQPEFYFIIPEVAAGRN